MGRHRIHRDRRAAADPTGVGRTRELAPSAAGQSIDAGRESSVTFAQPVSSSSPMRNDRLADCLQAQALTVEALAEAVSVAFEDR